jgi:glycosyltransferase involved in cell wall biosynthesis
MNINFISYLNPIKYSGGGEMINRELIEKGISRGHHISLTSVKDRENEIQQDADLYILADIFNFPHTLRSRGNWLKFSEHFLSKIISNKPFMHLNTAYSDICNLGYLPCSGESEENCKYKSKSKIKQNIITRDFSKKCFSYNDLVRQSYLNSVANVFMSPLHKKIIVNSIGIPASHKSLVLNPIIDTNKFKNYHISRDIDYLFVGVLSEAKGFFELKEKFGKENIFIVGEIHPEIKLDFGTYLGKVPYDEIPYIMNRAKNFVFLPRWPEPQGRVVIEAALSGCNLITNGNVGAISFPYDISDPRNIGQSNENFWKELEELFL